MKTEDSQPITNHWRWAVNKQRSVSYTSSIINFAQMQSVNTVSVVIC